jgi:hypothetical protein
MDQQLTKTKLTNDAIYFANLTVDELAGELQKKVDDYYQYVRINGMLDLWRKLYRQYFKAGYHLGDTMRGGDTGEYSFLFINHYRSILQAILSITVSQRPAFDARAVNNDYSSQAQTKLAQGLLDYYMREKRLERYVADVAEFAIWSGEGYLACNWDIALGKEYGVGENNEPIREGDIRFMSCSGIDVIRHPYLRKFEDRSWLILREFVNKYELAKRYPEFETDILNSTMVSGNLKNDFLDFYRINDSDMIPMYRFYHDKTSNVPNGRYSEFIEGGTVLFDSDLPYPEIPIYALHPGSIYASPFGYSVSFDMLPIQRAIDGLASTIQTNQEAFGVQNVLVPKGSNLDVEELSGGMNIVQYDSKMGKPEPLNLTATPVEIFNRYKELINEMESISGINSVVRGNPEASLKSGAALALVASQAIQFLQLTQQRYVQLLEDSGTAIINMLKAYATVPRVATIVGKMNTPYMREFKGADLENVNRVIVDMGNPLSKTTAGKIQIADTLLNYGFIKNPDMYFSVLQNGRLDSILDPVQRQLMLISQENESMSMGIDPPVLITDNHAMHIQEHKQLLDSPESRGNIDLVAIVLGHIQEHINQLKTGDPDLFSILGIQPLPPSNPQGQGGNVPISDLENPIAVNPTEQVIGSLPSMPTNPMTGEQYQTPSGQAGNAF